MNRKLLTIACLAALSAEAQTAYKVDINEFSRNNMDEVLEPGFTPWKFPKDCSEATLTMDDGVTFTMRTEQNMRGGWNKAFVQTKANNARLTGDGVNLDPNECGSMTLVVKGLAPGKHNIQTYHNGWADPANTVGWPITVSLNGQVVHRSVARTLQVSSAQEATVLMTEFSVGSTDDEVLFTFTTSDDDSPADAGTKKNSDRTPILNGFMIDVANTTLQAKLPLPADMDMHVDADEGSLLLKWSAANTAVVAHRLYFGTDSASVANADAQSELCLGSKEAADTTQLLSGLYSMNTYYWRVDETAADGTETHGAVWKFRPRHLAFPGAEGYGRFATGGRGGVVYHVTNLLNDENPGSLRYALTQMSGPRTIVFDVSGIIDMDFKALFANPYVTIAAQTAPGKGICLRHSNLNIGSESICRFLRARRGYGDTGNAMGVTGANHTIVDHTTCSWGTDETFSSRGAHNVTFQHSMIAEALGIADHKNYAAGKNHGFAATIGGETGSFHHNLLADCSGRNWSMGGGLDGNGYYSGRLDIFNNVVYNWCKRTTDGGAHEVNFVGNYYKEGPAVDNHCIFTLQLEGTGKGTQSAYLKNNILDRLNGTILMDASSLYAKQVSSSQVVDWEPFASEPFFPSYAVIDSPQDAYKKTLCSVGADQPMQDANDQRMVSETLQRSYTYVGSRSGLKGEIDHEDDCGGFEDYPEESRPAGYDTDQDGMPDWWEALAGSNPAEADHNADPDHDGYTQLEDYLNWLAEPHYVIDIGGQQLVDLKKLFAGFTKSPAYKAETLSGSALVTVDNGQLSMKVTEQGLTAVDVTVADSEGSTMTRRVNIAATADEAAGISTVRTADAQAQPVYTLGGIRTDEPHKGINIQKGKKYVRK